MRRSLFMLAALALFATVAVFGGSQESEAQGCSYSSGIVDCFGWEFAYNLSTASVTPTGLTLQNVEFGDESMMYQAHFASLPVKYDYNACGPYVDLFSTLTNSDPTGVQGGTFTQNGVSWLELGAHYQIGSYVLYTAFYFSDQGEMQMRMFARGLQCNQHHIHYPMFVVDADVEGNTTIGNDGQPYHGAGDEIYYFNGNDWVRQAIETDNLVAQVGHDFIVRDPDSGKTVSINYDGGVFAPPSGGVFDVQAAANNRVYTRQSNGPGDLAWPGAQPGTRYLSGDTGFGNGEWGYNDGQAITDPVVVVRGFLDHQVGGALPDDWHTSGISVKFVDDPLAAEPTPTATPLDPTPTPTPSPTATPADPTPTATTTPLGPTPTPTPTVEVGSGLLTNGERVTGLETSANERLDFRFEIPADASSYTVQIRNGIGDADLYTRMGAAPTANEWDCRPYVGGNNETCNIDVSQAGQLFVSVYGYTDFTAVTLLARHDGGGGGQQAPTTTPTSTPVAPTPTSTAAPLTPTPTPVAPTPTPTPTPANVPLTPTPTPTPPGSENALTNGQLVPGLSAQQNDLLQYTFDIPPSATAYTVQLTGNDGDADLYVRMGAAPTAGQWDCRPYLDGNNETCTGDVPPSGRLYVTVHAYADFDNATLVASY